MTDYQRIEKVIVYLEKSYIAQPSLRQLADVAGLSESHFQRLFCRWTGTSPKTFVQFLTAQHAKKILAQSTDLLTASLAAGLSGPGRLHDLMISMEAVTPGEFKSAGKGVEIRYGIHGSPFGKCLIGVTARGICHLSFLDSDERIALAEMRGKWKNATFKLAKAKTAKIVKSIFESSGRRKIKVLVQGTVFQLKVWEALLSIPEGAAISYHRLAKFTGSPRAARAVGSAVAKNSIAFLIPCHRVLRETGAFGEYRWGPVRKRALLTWEGARKVAAE